MRYILKILFLLAFYSTTMGNTFIIPDIQSEKYSETQMVIASGIGKTEASSLDSAISIAVERVVGTMVTSETYIKNGTLIEEKIVRLSPAYVKTYKVIQIKNRNGFIQTTIEAEVMKQKLAEKLNETSISILEVDDTRLAHANFLAELSKYKDSKEELAKIFRLTFGIFPSNIDININNFRYMPAQIQNKEIDFELDFSMRINIDDYNKKADILEKAFIEYGNLKVEKEYFIFSIINRSIKIENRDENKNYFYEIPKSFFIIKKKGGKYVADRVDYSDAPEDMKNFIINGLMDEKIVQSIYNLYFHVKMTDDNNDIVYEDFIPIQSKGWFNNHYDVKPENNPQENTYIIFKDPETDYLGEYQLSPSSVPYEETSNFICAELFLLSKWSCPDRNKENLKHSFALTPFFNYWTNKSTRLEYRIDHTSELDLRYKGKVKVNDIKRIKNISINISERD